MHCQGLWSGISAFSTAMTSALIAEANKRTTQTLYANLQKHLDVHSLDASDEGGHLNRCVQDGESCNAWDVRWCRHIHGIHMRLSISCQLHGLEAGISAAHHWIRQTECLPGIYGLALAHRLHRAAAAGEGMQGCIAYSTYAEASAASWTVLRSIWPARRIQQASCRCTITLGSSY